MSEIMTGKEIADAVNAIIESLDKSQFKEAINWGDLKVNEVDIIHPVYPEAGRPFTKVIIDEADPGSYNFCAEIAKQFNDNYGFEISVESEW